MSNHLHLFTKHPFLVDSHDHSICIEVDGQPYNIAAVASIDVLEPASEELNAKFWYGPESRANAYLLRAAPELLRSLEQLVEWAKDNNMEPPSDSHPITIAIKAIESALMVTPGKETDGDPAEFEAV